VKLEFVRDRKSEILELAASHGARNARLFGSVARGDSREDSDVDLLVDLDAGRSLFVLGGLLMDLSDLLGAEVDLIEAGCLHPYVRDRVLAEAVPL